MVTLVERWEWRYRLVAKQSNHHRPWAIPKGSVSGFDRNVCSTLGTDARSLASLVLGANFACRSKTLRLPTRRYMQAEELCNDSRHPDVQFLLFQGSKVLCRLQGLTVDDHSAPEDRASPGEQMDMNVILSTQAVISPEAWQCVSRVLLLAP